MQGSGMYDKDCTTWSPQGEIPQIKYVLNAVTNGTVVLGLKSNKHAVLACFKKQQKEGFSSHDEKMFMIDDHCGIAIAGLTADARVLAEYMRSECLNHKYTFDGPMNVGRLVHQIGDKSQLRTLYPGQRPYGVGMLVQAYDEALGKTHIYETSPSGDYYEYHAFAIGARAQAAKTYLEKHFESFATASKEDLIKHAIKALDVTTETEQKLSTENCDITVVGEGAPWKKLSGDELKPHVEALHAADGPAPMDTDP